MDIADIWLASPLLLYGTAALAGLLIGSFLNVVVARLPEAIEGAPAEPLRYPPSGPRSRCPVCHSLIRWQHNVPLISFAALRGRCADCRHAISWRYPIMELGGAVAVAVAVITFGATLQALAAGVLLVTLLALTVIDLEHMLLPDNIVLPLLWLGLLSSTQGLFASAPEAILGAAAGYAALWMLYQAHRLASGREGMGYGDFKLAAALGAWVGFEALPAVLLLAFTVGTLAAGATMLRRRGNLARPLPFGPALACAGGCGVLAPQEIDVAFRLLTG